MLSLHKPTYRMIREFLHEQRMLDVTYSEIGSTKEELPPKYFTHEFRLLLGNDSLAFAKAKNALDAWDMFQTNWTELFPKKLVISEGETVAVLARVCGMWTLNACRILYVIQENHLFGFGYGTLPGHAEVGEERFQVVQQEDGSVWYEVRAFFKPRHLLARLAWPYLHHKVNQFRTDSADAMRRSVENHNHSLIPIRKA